MSHSWGTLAAERTTFIMKEIPFDWRLSPNDLSNARIQRSITGPFICKYLDRFEREYLNHDTISILRRIWNGEWTAVQCVRASCKISCIAHQINPCLLNIMIPEALEKARKLDESFKGGRGSVKGFLHGLPISVKDQFHVKGSDTTMGYVGWIGTFEGDGDDTKVGAVESQVISDLEGQGAVVFCKTSLPQTVLYDETINNIIGQTLNPVNRLLSCGGSSGGEAALISTGGSSLGMGTDIAGSVRVPAAFCGIYGIKPSHNRFSYRGVANTNPGQTLIPSSVGFLSRSLEGLELVMSSLLSTSPWLRDPAVVPIPWREDDRLKARKKLKFGIFWWDGMIQPHPPVTRALEMVVNTLEYAGHEVVDWCPPSHSIPERLHASSYNERGWFSPYTAAVSIIGTADSNGNMVDAVLMPAAPHAAVIPGKWVHLAYTEVLNLLDYTALVIPVTHADKHMDELHAYVPVSEKDSRNWTAYDAEIYHGAPVGIQIVGRVCEEEKIIGVAEVVEGALGM
ncbi:9e052d19-2454-43ac-b681-e7888495d497 [Sclerotinia trifoliorum]|uniref:amidase n=1 Tax=Sclerotinia trifoliorum TaxID=28548 RepID=A0A8H2VXJ3_9HELO|nr:9e052d19-2454-43ac-b681-e7888495d497 [Sclerotinia trifoliorum]